MKICRFEELKNRGSVYECLVQSIRRGNLVPVIGSGFTSGMQAKRNAVPSSSELKKMIIDLCCKYGGATFAGDRDELEKLDLSEIADFFVGSFEQWNKESETLGKEFLDYFEDCYSFVKDVPDYKRQFLLSGWQYIYTLNYDDMIERVLNNYEIITPYKKLNARWLRDKGCVIKLHGDVRELLRTGDLCYCILSKKQYLDAINNDNNKDLMLWLQNDYMSKDLLYVGCSLTNEYDFLFVDNVISRKMANGSYGSSFYVYYDQNMDEDIPLVTKMKLENYGIKNIIRVSPDEMTEFCYFIRSLWDESERISQSDRLNDFRDYTFMNRDTTSNQENISYLFSNTYLFKYAKSQKVIQFPSFQIRRDVEDSITDAINSGKPICVLTGNRMSGKTYVLLDLLNEMQRQRRDVYYISGIRISDDIVDYICQKCNSIFLFDSGVLLPEQLMEKFYENTESMIQHKIQIVCAIEKADREYANAFERRDEVSESKMQFFSVDSILSDEELVRFNNKIKLLTLVERKAYETFLDYAIKIENTSLHQYPSLIPETNFLSADNPAMIECVIVLAVNSAFDNETAGILRIYDQLTELCDKADIAVQRDYLSFFEQSWGKHSGVKYVANSAYWLYRCLSNYAKSPHNYPSIAKAILNIIDRYQNYYVRRYGVIGREFYRTVKSYYYLNDLQKMFFSDAPDKSSLQLPDTIYTQLRGKLADDYQFLHQAAKCKLRLGRRLKQADEQLAALDIAKKTLDRAYDIAKGSRGSNLDYTLVHMQVTRALIITNYLRYCNQDVEIQKKHLHTAIDSYYCIYIEKRCFLDDMSGIFERNEQSDVEWFMNSFFISGNSSLRSLVSSREDQWKIQAILNEFYNKRITITW